jgi:hypothetical protein
MQFSRCIPRLPLRKTGSTLRMDSGESIRGASLALVVSPTPQSRETLWGKEEQQSVSGWIPENPFAERRSLRRGGLKWARTLGLCRSLRSRRSVRPASPRRAFAPASSRLLWWAQVDSNFGLMPLPSVAAKRSFRFSPSCFRPRKLSLAVVGSSGLEPPTSRLSGVRSNRLSYEPSWWR